MLPTWRNLAGLLVDVGVRWPGMLLTRGLHTLIHHLR